MMARAVTPIESGTVGRKFLSSQLLVELPLTTGFNVTGEKSGLAAAQAGRAGVPVLRLLGASQPGDRPEVASTALVAIRRAVPQLMLAGKDLDAEAVLEAALEFGPLPDVAADYALFQYDRGRSQDTLARFEPQQSGTTRQASVARWVVSHLYRARNETDRALKSLEGITDITIRNRFRQVLLADAGRWKELADAMTAQTGIKERLVLLQLAGREADLTATIATLGTRPNGMESVIDPPLRQVQALLLVNRLDEAARVARTMESAPVLTLQLQAMQFRLTQALALPGGPEAVAKWKTQKVEAWGQWQLERAKWLAQLGRFQLTPVVDEIDVAGCLLQLLQPTVPQKLACSQRNGLGVIRLPGDFPELRHLFLGQIQSHAHGEYLLRRRGRAQQR